MNLPAWLPGTVRLCEFAYWDEGEFVYCHAPAVRRDPVTFAWCCGPHAEAMQPSRRAGAP